MNKAICPACTKILQIQEESKVQEIITCPHCTALLELVNKLPPVLDWAEDPAVNSSRRVFVKLFRCQQDSYHVESTPPFLDWAFSDSEEFNTTLAFAERSL